MTRALVLVCLLVSSCLSGEEVLKEHIRDKFTKYHNNIRELRRRPPLRWSPRLAADAHVNALKLGALCFSNGDGNDRANVLQVWGARTYTPSQVIVAWLRREKPRAVILNPDKKFMGCSYVPCKDSSSFATAVIYVCHYSEEYQ